MNSVMGLINLYEDESLIPKLTQNRPLAAVSFAGRYRLIDFALSNLVNSGVQNVGILMRDKIRSLMDHLRSGKEWDLARKRDGLFLLPPSQKGTSEWMDDAPALEHHLDYLKKCRQEYVIMSGTNTVFTMDYMPMLKFHEKTGADITMLYHQEEDSSDFSRATVMSMTDTGEVTDLAINPAHRYSNSVGMGVYLMRREFLMNLVRDCCARGGKNILKDGILPHLKEYRVFGYRYNGYVAKIDTTLKYYKHSMEIVKEENWSSLFNQDAKVLTKIKDEAPAKYKEQAEVSQSIVANGCVINGKVENSVLFRGVKIEAGAVVRNSVLMQRCVVKAGAVLENVICDKDGNITEGRYLKGETNYPLLVEKGVVI